MTQAKSASARAVLLAAGTAGFVALGAGVAGAEGLASPVHEIAPSIERTLAGGVAPTMNSLAPEGVGPIANTALAELQETAHNPEKPAPDLAAPLPDGQAVRTPAGELPNPTSALADTVAGAQDATGLDGDPHDTVGHSAGRALQHGGQEAGAAVEQTARGAGSTVEDTAVQVVPHTVEAVYGLRESVALPRTGQAAQFPDTSPLPDVSALPALSALTGGGLPVLDSVGTLVSGDPLGLDSPATIRQSSSRTPGLGDLTGALWTAASQAEGLGAAEAEPLEVNGPLADAGLPRLSGTGLPPVDDAVGAVLPQLADTGLPRVVEGSDTQTAEDLATELGRGTDLLNDIDTSDLLSVEGGTVPQETPEGMTQHPTFMDLPGSEALPLVS